jgi:hypothetical protein
VRPSLALAGFFLVACGSLNESRVLAGGTLAPTPMPGRPLGTPAPGTVRVKDDLGGWSIDMPTAWFEVAQDFHGRTIRNKPFTPYDFPPPRDQIGLSLRMEFARAGEENVDLSAFADQRVWVATCRPCRRILEQSDLSIGGQLAKSFTVHQNQPTPFDRYEPHLYWLVRSPFFADRVVVITGGPATADARLQLERIIATLQFYRPAPPVLVPMRTKAEAITTIAPGASITRSSAKLMLAREFERAYNDMLRSNAGGPAAVYGGVDPDTLVWVVAIEGSGFTPMKSGPPGPAFDGPAPTPRQWAWAIAVVPARAPFGWMGLMTGGPDPTWPAWYDALVDRS